LLDSLLQETFQNGAWTAEDSGAAEGQREGRQAQEGGGKQRPRQQKDCHGRSEDPVRCLQVCDARPKDVQAALGEQAPQGPPACRTPGLR